MTRMQRAVHVVGVGMIPFTKPGASAPYHEMGAQAARLALDDAGVDYAKVQQAYVGYVYGDSTAGLPWSRHTHSPHRLAGLWRSRRRHHRVPDVPLGRPFRGRGRWHPAW